MMQRPNVLATRGSEAEQDAEIAEAKPLLQRLYELCGADGPRAWLVLDTPYEGQNARYFSMNRDKDRKEVLYRRSRLWKAVDWATVGDLGSSLSHRVSELLRQNVVVAERAASVWDQRTLMGKDVRTQRSWQRLMLPNASSMLPRPTLYGQFEIWGDEAEVSELGQVVLELAKLAGACYLYSEVCVITRKPSHIMVDDEGFLQGERDEPALLYESTLGKDQVLFAAAGHKILSPAARARRTTKMIAMSLADWDFTAPYGPAVEVPSRLYWRVYTAIPYLYGFAGERVTGALSPRATCRHEEHEAPADTCTCGYYGVSSPEGLKANGLGGDCWKAIALVEALGNALEYSEGVRCEQIRIVGMAPDLAGEADLLRILVRGMDIPVYESVGELETVAKPEWEAIQRMKRAEGGVQ